MRFLLFILVFGAIVLGGCGSATERKNSSGTQGDVRMTVSVIDLEQRRFVLEPDIYRYLMGVDICIGQAGGWMSGFEGGSYTIVDSSGRRSGKSFEVTLPGGVGHVSWFLSQVAEDAVEVRCKVSFTDKGVHRSGETSAKLSLKEGQSYLAFLPDDGSPRVLFIFGCVNVKSGEAVQGD